MTKIQRFHNTLTEAIRVIAEQIADQEISTKLQADVHKKIWELFYELMAHIGQQEHWDEHVRFQVILEEDKVEVLPTNLYTTILMAGLEMPPNPAALKKRGQFKGDMATYTVEGQVTPHPTYMAGVVIHTKKEE